MKRMLVRLIPALALCLPALAFGQQKLLLTFAVTTPTEAEAIGLYNPGSTVVDLANYYVSDSDAYYKVVAGTAPGSSDFIAKFPANASIGPGEWQWISIGGAECFKQPLGKGPDAGVGANSCATGPGFLGYGIYPNYEFASTSLPQINSPDVPDMEAPFTGAIKTDKGITNAGEPVILFYWDGNSASLVVDIDYAYVGATANVTSNPPVNKTGVSTYKTEVGDGTDRRAPLPDGGAFLGTCRRFPYSEGTQLTTGGNGFNGSDETSENTSSTWEACRSLPVSPSFPDAGDVPGLDAAEPGLDAAEPGLDAAVVIDPPDAAEPGLDATVVVPPDAAAPGLDATVVVQPDAAAPGPDATVVVQPDAAAPGPDATVVVQPDAAAPGPDATVVVVTDASVNPGLDAAAQPGPDADVVVELDAAVEPVVDASVNPGLDATAVEPADAASEEEPADAAFVRKDAGKKADTGTSETTATGCSCGSTNGSGFASTSLFGMLALGLIVRRKRA